MTPWAATVRASDGQVVLRMTRTSEAVAMDAETARQLAVTLLVVAECVDPVPDHFEADAHESPTK